MLCPDDRSAVSCIRSIGAALPKHMLIGCRAVAPCTHSTTGEAILGHSALPWPTAFEQLIAGNVSNEVNGQQSRLAGCHMTSSAACCRRTSQQHRLAAGG